MKIEVADTAWELMPTAVFGSPKPVIAMGGMNAGYASAKVRHLAQGGGRPRGMAGHQLKR